MIKNSNTLSVEDKFAKVLSKLRNLRPFYSAIYESMERVKSDSIDTMGVTISKMLYNEKFVDEIPFEQFMFINLHEIAHVALMHVSRGKRRNPELWNIACDVYVNKLLADEFKIEPGKTDITYNVSFPLNVLYCSSIDLNEDCVEDLYDNFLKQAEDNNFFDMNGNDNFKLTISGKNNSNNDRWSTLEINISSNYVYDIVDDGMTDDIEKENENKRILSEAKTKYDMLHSGIGNDVGILGRKVDDILKSHIDWRKLLKKYCREATSTDSSFRSPDKRMYYQRAIYPGQSIDEGVTLKSVKVCFDVSGSISEVDLGYFYGQVRDILKTFKINAELLYWDMGIQSSNDLMNMKQLENIDITGGGGTDPSCIFEYFDSKACKEKPIVTLVFTDGYFFDRKFKQSWKRKYKDTIWIMTRNYNKDYKPSFGTRAIARFSE